MGFRAPCDPLHERVALLNEDGSHYAGSRNQTFAFFDFSTEMQENTWARLRESSMHQGVSHAT